MISKILHLILPLSFLISIYCSNQENKNNYLTFKSIKNRLFLKLVEGSLHNFKFEIVEVMIAIGALFHNFDFIIDAFKACGIYFVPAVVDNAISISKEHVSKFS